MLQIGVEEGKLDRLRTPQGELIVVTKDIKEQAKLLIIPEFVEEEQLATQKQEVSEEKLFVPALFYCRWLPEKTEKEKKIKKSVQDCYPNCCFNHRVGMPTITYRDPDSGREWQSDPIEFAGYEKSIIESLELVNYWASCKCRGAGESELITVRRMAYKYAVECRIPDRKCLISAGTSRSLADGFIYRIKQLTDKISFVYKIKPKTATPAELFFQFGLIKSVPADEDAVRGEKEVGDVVFEESSVWDLVDDVPVLMGGEPHVFKSNATIIVIFTPKGKRGFAWSKIYTDEVGFKTKYVKHTVNWREVVALPVRKYDDISKVVAEAEIWIGKPFEIRKKYFMEKYKKDSDYRKWFDAFFNVTIEELFDLQEPIISVAEIIRLAKEDPATYQQEADNEFISELESFIGKLKENPDIKVEEW